MSIDWPYPNEDCTATGEQCNAQNPCRRHERDPLNCWCPKAGGYND